MDIIKCGCSRSIHIYADDHGKCPFCGNPIANGNKFTNALDGLPSSLGEKLAEIDNCIGAKQSKKALELIDNILEWIPGWEIGATIPRSGEIYWRKLLAEAECKSDFELLGNKVKSLRNFTAFKNAKEYANVDERPVYALIEQTALFIEKYLDQALTEQEDNEKCKTGVDAKLIEYKQRAGELEAAARKHIAALEKAEKLLRDQAIDCEVAFKEYIYGIEALKGEAQEIRNTCAARNSTEEITNVEAQAPQQMDIKQQTIAMLEKLKAMVTRNSTEETTNVEAQAPQQMDIKQRIIAMWEKLKAMVNGYFSGTNTEETQKARDKSLPGISGEEKTKWEAQLDKILSESNAELSTLKTLAASQDERMTHWRFAEYLLSLSEQQSVIKEISQNKVESDILRSEAEQLVNDLEEISNEYNEAREAVAAGNYAPAWRLLDGVVFNSIIRQAMSDTKVDAL